MQRLIVNDRQAEVIREARRKVEVRDPAGKVVGYVIPAPSEEDRAEAARRLAEALTEPAAHRN